MNLPEAFLAYIYQENLFTKKDRLLLAISGGVDSVVLATILQQTGFDFGMAHCNFQLRAADSLRDEAFVRGFSEKLNRPFHSVRFDTEDYASTHKLSIQVAARDLRYQWFEQMRQQHGYDYILTAHHRDDNVETLLINFFRGTGINGLTGIQPMNDRVRRPLLFARRSELETFLKTEGIAFVQDESNLKNDYTRNWLRNQLIPELSKHFPGLGDNLSGNIQRFREAAVLYRQSVDSSRKRLLRITNNGHLIAVLQLRRMPAWETILLELIRPFGFKATQLPEVAALLESGSGKYLLSATHRILKDRRHLIITALEHQERLPLIIEGMGQHEFAGGALRLSKESNLSYPVDPKIAIVDAALLRFPLILRPWRQGDYFYPLGMRKKKKLARFFIDQKLSLAEKEKIWVLESDRKIIWIPGYRLDDRFKVTAGTKTVYKLHYYPGG